MISKVKVGPITYKVTMNRQKWLQRLNDSNMGDAFGICSHKDATIFLNGDLTADVIRLTLWHEVLHAVVEVFTPSGAFSNLLVDDEEENVVGLLESGTLQVILDNPKLIKYLQEGN